MANEQVNTHEHEDNANTPARASLRTHSMVGPHLDQVVVTPHRRNTKDVQRILAGRILKLDLVATRGVDHVGREFDPMPLHAA